MSRRHVQGVLAKTLDTDGSFYKGRIGAIDFTLEGFVVASGHILKFIEIAPVLRIQYCHAISMKLEIAARQLESLGSPVRLKIYRALVRAGEDGLACGVLQEKV